MSLKIIKALSILGLLDKYQEKFEAEAVDDWVVEDWLKDSSLNELKTVISAAGHRTKFVRTFQQLSTSSSSLNIEDSLENSSPNSQPKSIQEREDEKTPGEIEEPFKNSPTGNILPPISPPLPPENVNNLIFSASIICKTLDLYTSEISEKLKPKLFVSNSQLQSIHDSAMEKALQLFEDNQEIGIVSSEKSLQLKKEVEEKIKKYFQLIQEKNLRKREVAANEVVEESLQKFTNSIQLQIQNANIDPDDCFEEETIENFMAAAKKSSLQHFFETLDIGSESEENQHDFQGQQTNLESLIQILVHDTKLKLALLQFNSDRILKNEVEELLKNYREKVNSQIENRFIPAQQLENILEAASKATLKLFQSSRSHFTLYKSFKAKLLEQILVEEDKITKISIKERTKLILEAEKKSPRIFPSETNPIAESSRASIDENSIQFNNQPESEIVKASQEKSVLDMLEHQFNIHLEILQSSKYLVYPNVQEKVEKIIDTLKTFFPSFFTPENRTIKLETEFLKQSNAMQKLNNENKKRRMEAEGQMNCLFDSLQKSEFQRLKQAAEKSIPKPFLWTVDLAKLHRHFDSFLQSLATPSSSVYDLDFQQDCQETCKHKIKHLCETLNFSTSLVSEYSRQMQNELDKVVFVAVDSDFTQLHQNILSSTLKSCSKSSTNWTILDDLTKSIILDYEKKFREGNQRIRAEMSQVVKEAVDFSLSKYTQFMDHEMSQGSGMFKTSEISEFHKIAYNKIKMYLRSQPKFEINAVWEMSWEELDGKLKNLEKYYQEKNAQKIEKSIKIRSRQSMDKIPVFQGGIAIHLNQSAIQVGSYQKKTGFTIISQNLPPFIAFAATGILIGEEALSLSIDGQSSEFQTNFDLFQLLISDRNEAQVVIIQNKVMFLRTEEIFAIFLYKLSLWISNIHPGFHPSSCHIEFVLSPFLRLPVKQLVTNALNLAGFSRAHILQSTSAMALTYFHHNPEKLEQNEAPHFILSIHSSPTTFDLVLSEGSRYKIASWRQTGLPCIEVSSDGLREPESVNLAQGHRGHVESESNTEELLKGLLRSVLEECKLKTSDIQTVFLVGVQSQVQNIQKVVQDLFSRRVRVLDECAGILRGAAAFAAWKSGVSTFSKKLKMSEIRPYSLTAQYSKRGDNKLTVHDYECSIDQYESCGQGPTVVAKTLPPEASKILNIISLREASSKTWWKVAEFQIGNEDTTETIVGKTLQFQISPEGLINVQWSPSSSSSLSELAEQPPIRSKTLWMSQKEMESAKRKLAKVFSVMISKSGSVAVLQQSLTSASTTIRAHQGENTTRSQSYYPESQAQRAEIGNQELDMEKKKLQLLVAEVKGRLDNSLHTSLLVRGQNEELLSEIEGVLIKTSGVALDLLKSYRQKLEIRAKRIK